MPRNEIVIRLVVPEWTRRRWLGLMTMLLLIGGTAAWALTYQPPKPRTKGDPLSSDYFNTAFKDIENKFTDVDKQIAALQAEPDCPRGYYLEKKPWVKGNLDSVQCKSNNLQNERIVKVGRGASGFWIDMFEASLGDAPVGVNFYGIAPQDAHKLGFLENGQWTKPMYAVSNQGVVPAAWVTWFQANGACRLAGKRLPTGDEWITAARGTPDVDGICNISSGVPWGNEFDPIEASGKCQSSWGAHNMIGNLREWTAEWYTGAGELKQVNGGVSRWPGGYNADGTWNVQGWVERGDGVVNGLPAAALRGGDYTNKTTAGIFSLDLERAPSSTSKAGGFRCVIK